MCRVWLYFLPNDPERASRSRSLTGLIQYDGQIPQLLTPPVAGGVSHHDLPVLYAPEDDEMSAGGKMPLCHNSDYQFPITQSVQDALGLRCRTALHRQAPCFRRAGNQGVVGTALAAPAAVLIGPFRHLHRINDVVCQGGHYNGHGGGAAAVAADVVCAVGFIGPAFIQLVEVDHLGGPINEADISQRGNRSAAVLGVLEHSIAQKQAEVLGIVPGQRLLVVGQMEHRISKITLPIVGERVDVSEHT